MGYKEDVRPEDTLRESANKILNAHISGDVVIIVGKCTVDYNGRAWTYLDLGKRSVTINPSGAVVVNGSKSVKPKNWQPSDADTKIRMDEDGDMIIDSVRSNPDESLQIRFTDILKSIHYDPPENQVEVEGTEDDVHEELIKNPEYIEDGLDITEHEKEVETGSIDLFGFDSKENEVIIEVKTRKGQIKNIDQLNRYVTTYDSDVRGILAAPDIADTAKDHLDSYGYEYVKINPAKMFDKE